MKIVLAILIVLLLAGAGGTYWYLKQPKSDDLYQMQQTESESGEEVMSGDVTKTGKLQQSQGDDYNHIILSEGKAIGVASQSLDLDQYVGKTVSVTGQYSGTTLYADSVTEVE